MIKFRIIVISLLLAALCGCSGDADDIGIVARVNGSPIYLTQLEFQHDQFQADTAGAYVPSVEKLRSEYGDILADLIVQELVAQELAHRDMAVTDEELKAAEEAVRSDYPEGAFEQVLVEEYIDLKSWRRQLRYHLAQKKFYQLVLRPQIKIDYKEAEKYYRDHISDYYLPESLRIMVVRGPSRELVERAVEKYRNDQDQMNLTTAFGEVETREVMVREGRMSAAWRNAVSGLEPGQSSTVLADKFGFEALVLLERSKAKVLEPAQAYPLVEEALLEDKLHNAFDEWLSGALESAQISVSEHLLNQAIEERPKEDIVQQDALQQEAASQDEAARQDEAAGQEESVMPPEAAGQEESVMPPEAAGEEEGMSGGAEPGDADQGKAGEPAERPGN